MANQEQWSHVLATPEAPAEIGPDYVALVIEWNDGWNDGENEVTQVMERLDVAVSPDLKKLMIGAGSPLASASRMACEKLPAPLDAVVVTVKVPGATLTVAEVAKGDVWPPPSAFK